MDYVYRLVSISNKNSFNYVSIALGECMDVRTSKFCAFFPDDPLKLTGVPYVKLSIDSLYTMMLFVNLCCVQVCMRVTEE